MNEKARTWELINRPGTGVEVVGPEIRSNVTVVSLGALDAARADERSKLEARLLSDEVLGAVEEGFGAAYEVKGGVAHTHELWRAAVRAALASQEKP
jgi:hypothetical protein